MVCRRRAVVAGCAAVASRAASRGALRAGPSAALVTRVAGEQGAQSSSTTACASVRAMTKPRFTLYSNFESGNAYKVALMLTLCGEPYEYVHMEIFSGAAKSDEHKARNKFGEVPVLVDNAKNRTLAQSGVILVYLARELGKFRVADELKALEWVAWEGHRLLAGFARARFLRRFTPGMDASVLAYIDVQARNGLNVLEERLASSPFLEGDTATIVDLLCAGYMWMFDETGQSESDWPNVVAWRSRLEKLPGWKHPRELLPRP
jgi:glutathione S-transferase